MPIIYTILIISVLLFNSAGIDFIGFKNEYHNSHNALLMFGAIALPLLVLLRSDSSFRGEKNETKLLIFGITSFAVSLHFNNHFNNLFSAVYGVSIVLYLWKQRKFYTPTKLYMFVVFYFIINAISLMWTNNLPDGIGWLQLHFILIYIPLGFCLFRLSKMEYSTITIAFFRWVLFFSVFSVCCWILQSKAFGIPLSEAFTMVKKPFLNKYDPYNIIFAWSNYTHPTFLAVMMMLGLSIGWYNAIKKEVALVELVLLIILVLLCSIVTQSRFMIVAWLLINILFIVYWLKTNPKQQGATIVAIVVVAVLVSAFYPNKIKSFFSDNVRSAHYQAAYQAIEENCFWGTGLGGMTKYINGENPIYLPVKDDVIRRIHAPKTDDELIKLRATTSIDFIGLNPHNQPLGDLMQTGVFGLLSILSIAIYLIYNTIKYRNRLLGGFTIVYLLLMMVEMPLMVDKGIFIFALFAFLFEAKAR